MMLSMDDGTFVFIVSFAGFKLEAAVGIHLSMKALSQFGSSGRISFRDEPHAFRASRFECSDSVQLPSVSLQQSIDGGFQRAA